MPLTYRAEYRLGRRGRARAVGREYGGLRALLMIAAVAGIALLFGVVDLAFGLVAWALRVARELIRLVALALRDVVSTLARFVRDVATLPGRAIQPRPDRAPSKPAWVSIDEF